MAYITQEMKKELTPAIKAVLKKYGCKGSISINNHSSLVVTVKEGPIDFIGDCNQRNKEYADRTGGIYREIKDYVQFSRHQHNLDGTTSKKFLGEMVQAMMGDKWYDNSDIQVDYFDIAYYININIGRWDKPYKLI